MSDQQTPKDDNQISQEITVNGQKFRLSGSVNIKLEPIEPGTPVPNPDPDPEPGSGGEPTKPTEGTILHGGWGADMDPAKWIRTAMKDFPEQFKVTDGKKNVATNFKTAETADNFIKYFQRHPDQIAKLNELFGEGNNGGGEGGGTDTGGGGNTGGGSSSSGQPGSSIQLKYKQKTGGQNITKFSGPKYSEHGGKDRCSLYSEPKSAASATNAQVGGYVRMKLGKKDQILYKVLSGGHGDNDSMGGRCYGVGFEIEGNDTQFHAVKELNHPDTPRITDKIEKLFTGRLPSLNGKTVGYRVNHWVNQQGHTVVEFDADFSVLDTPPEQLKEAPNQWQPMFRFVDKGVWGLSKEEDEDTNIKENSGITYPKAGILGYYFRADEVGEGDGSASLEQFVEIEAPN